MEENTLRSAIRQSFEDYVSSFDRTDERVRLKIVHTHHVAENCDELATLLHLSERERDLAFLTGMLHDIARFEQVKMAASFLDAVSFDHGDVAADMLSDRSFGERFLPTGSLTEEERTAVITAVRHHNKYDYPDDLPPLSRLLTEIIRDADKIDIYRVSVVDDFEAVSEYPADVTFSSFFTPSVYACTVRHETVLISFRKTPADNYLSRMALLYGLIFRESRILLESQGYIHQAMDHHFTDPKTEAEFQSFRSQAIAFLSER